MLQMFEVYLGQSQDGEGSHYDEDGQQWQESDTPVTPAWGGHPDLRPGPSQRPAHPDPHRPTALQT